MYNYASKICIFFSDPTAVAVFLSIAALAVWRNRRLSFALVLLLAILLGSLSSPPVAEFLVQTLERQNPDRGLVAAPEAPAIVVLGGALKMPSGEHAALALGEASDRLLVAYRLYRAGKAPLVVCSGGNNPLLSPAEGPGEAAGMCGLLEEWGVPSEALLREERSINTRENAVESRALLEARGIDRILLVTSAMHMPRAAAAFRKVGFTVETVPADFRSGWAPVHPLLGWLPTPTSLLDASIAIREWIGLWTYRSKGWA